MEKRPLQKAAATGANLRWPPKKGGRYKDEEHSQEWLCHKNSSGINDGGPESDRDKEFKIKKKEPRRKTCLRQAGRCYTSVCRKLNSLSVRGAGRRCLWRSRRQFVRTVQVRFMCGMTCGRCVERLGERKFCGMRVKVRKSLKEIRRFPGLGRGCGDIDRCCRMSSL